MLEDDRQAIAQAADDDGDHDHDDRRGADPFARDGLFFEEFNHVSIGAIRADALRMLSPSCPCMREMKSNARTSEM